jgi:hypothetical protein
MFIQNTKQDFIVFVEQSKCVYIVTFLLCSRIGRSEVYTDSPILQILIYNNYNFKPTLEYVRI